MKFRWMTLAALTALVLSGCKPKAPTVIIHNSCSGYTELRDISIPTDHTKMMLDSAGIKDSVGARDESRSFRMDSRIEIHPEDRVWLGRLEAIFPEAEVVDGEIKGEVHVWLGVNGLAWDSVPFYRMTLVLNGTGEPGLARDASYRFNVKFGLASLEPQNADGDSFTQTMVYCPAADVPLAEKLRDYLGAGEVQARTNLRDLIIVLGSDVIDKPATKPAPRGISITIKKSMFELWVFKNDQLIKKYPVAIGKNSGDKKRRGDNRTPEGDFTVVAIENSSSWEHDFGDGKGPIPGAYGPWFIRLSTLASETKSGKQWTGIGIHGTHDEASIGTRASEGCIRVRNADVDSLKRIVGVGTPVRIEE